jgi:hypothetical protein
VIILAHEFEYSIINLQNARMENNLNMHKYVVKQVYH